MATFSEKVTLGLGGIGILLLLIAVITTIFSLFEGGQNIMFAFLQLLSVLLAFPFLWHILNSYEYIEIWYKNALILECLASAILMPWISLGVAPDIAYVFFIFSALELIPLIFLFFKRYKFGKSGYKSKYSTPA